MNKYHSVILTEAKKFVTDLFKNKVDKIFTFHNLEHTSQVVKAVEEIALNYQLDNNDRFVLNMSAWFHDTGFSSKQVEDHETESIKIAKDFLSGYNIDPELIFSNHFMHTGNAHSAKPLSLVEMILCDSDLFHLGTKEFCTSTDLLKQEFENYFKINFTENEWCQVNIEFLISHKYFTGYCRKILEPVKQEWLKSLQDKQGTPA